MTLRASAVSTLADTVDPCLGTGDADMMGNQGTRPALQLARIADTEVVEQPTVWRNRP